MLTTAIFPGRYVQGAGAIEQCLAEELGRLGQRAFILQDPTVAALIGDDVAQTLAGKIDYHIEIFNRECCDEEIARISALTEEFGAQMIVAMGGGKTLDTAKATGAALKLPIVIIPTLHQPMRPAVL